MPRPIRIALAQLYSSPDISRNIASLKESLAKAAAEKANIIIFPEFYVQGVVAEAPHKVFTDGQAREELAALAKEYGIDVVVGTLVEKVHEPTKHDINIREHKTYNTAYYIDKHGKTLGQYRKRNLWHPEKSYLDHGEDHHLVFDTEYGRCGMLVCWDLAWPEAFRALFMQGVELVLIPSYWVADDITDEGLKHDADLSGEKSWLDSLVITRAYENECAVAFVNCGGPKEKGFLGRSAAALPFNGCVGRTAGSEEELKIVDIDLDVLTDARKVYMMKRDYEYGMKHGRFSGAHEKERSQTLPLPLR